MTRPATTHVGVAPEPRRRRPLAALVRRVGALGTPTPAADPALDIRLVWLTQADELRNQGRHSDAAELLQEAVLYYDNEVRAVAQTLKPSGSANGAAAWYEYGQCLNMLAGAEERLSGHPSPRRDDAFSAFARATAVDPSYGPAWEGAGAALAAAGRPADALPWLERATQLRPRSLRAWERRAAALESLGRDAEAAEARQRARSIVSLGRDDPRRPRSPLEAVASLGQPLITFVWREKRGLAITAVLYALGLVVWSVNAASRDLGPRAAADLQYLLAGLVPALVLAVALALLIAWFRVPAWSRDRLLARRPELVRRVSSFAGLLFTGGVALFAVLGWTGVLDRWPLLWVIPVGAVGIGIVLGGLAERGSWAFGFLWHGYGALGIALVAALAFSFYADAVYPRLPQSLGGGKPRCAQLDLDAASVSRATIAALGASASDRTVRTPRLHIVFAQGETLFVRRRGGSPVIELRSGSVRAVVACD